MPKIHLIVFNVDLILDTILNWGNGTKLIQDRVAD